MFSLSNMNVRVKLTVLCAAFIVGIVIFAAVSYSTVDAIKIGGDRYQSLIGLKDSFSNLSMPDATFMPSNFQYFRILLSANADEAKRDIEVFHESERRFQEARQAEMKRAGDDPELTTALSKAYAPVDDLFQIINAQIIPLVLAGKIEEAQQLRREKTAPLYKAHEEAITEANKILTARMQST